MGRELKRVPLDFDWPIGKIWYGYLMDTCLEDCESCAHYAKLKHLNFKDIGCPMFGVDPPVGDGYQLWENTSEGSPLTPVFETIEELVKYCATIFGSEHWCYDQWLRYMKER